MRRVVVLVLGMLGGVVVSLVATQLALLTAGAGGGDVLARRLVRVLATAALVAAAVMLGRWWPTAAMTGAAVVALLVSISLATFDGAPPTGVLAREPARSPRLARDRHRNRTTGGYDGDGVLAASHRLSNVSPIQHITPLRPVCP
ncbi:hypothetical protein [Georgenia sp. Marseille-Q6866]